MEDMHDAPNEKARYCIDIGGWVYCSSQETLKKSPTINQMLNNVAYDPDNVMFVDRDGAAFHFVLNFLRNGSVNAVEDRAYIEFLIGEAQFYGVRKMEAQLSKQLTERRRHDIHDVVLELRSIKLHLKSLFDNLPSERMDKKSMQRPASSTGLSSQERSIE